MLCDCCGREGEGESCPECGMTCCYDHLPPEFHKCPEQPCQRCGGEGRVVMPDKPGIRTRWYEDCPDCAEPKAGGAS